MDMKGALGPAFRQLTIPGDFNVRIQTIAILGSAVFLSGCAPSLKDTTRLKQPADEDLRFQAEITGGQIHGVSLEHNATGPLSTVNVFGATSNPVILVSKPEGPWSHCQEVQYKWKVRYSRRFSMANILATSAQIRELQSDQSTVQIFDKSEVPNLVLPPDGSILNAGILHFDWDPVPCADRYELTILKDYGHQTAPIYVISFFFGETEHTTLIPIDPGEYEWQVTASYNAPTPQPGSFTSIKSDPSQSFEFTLR